MTKLSATLPKSPPTWTPATPWPRPVLPIEIEDELRNLLANVNIETGELPFESADDDD